MRIALDDILDMNCLLCDMYVYDMTRHVCF